MYYAIYKNLRNSAWQCLLDFDLTCLPIDVLKITRSAGIKVIRNSIVNDLLPGENGKAYFDGERWRIIYNDSNSTELSRFTIAHELGHIFLGHELTHTKYAQASEFTAKPKSEERADQFAVRLLCPACVLWGLDLHTPNDIAKFCKVDIKTASIRAERMETLYARKKFLTDPLEQEVYNRFISYIQQEGLNRT